ncbi:uncharacterized protein LOC128559065 isoform X2 [Mercenaria mercenaria]|nr:uncharacterized protein LOC128559065 isoform X2 [Mercenaria mercenaria]
MTPLKKSKVEPFCVSRTKFVERWSKYVSNSPVDNDSGEDLSSSGIESEDDRRYSSSGHQSSSTDSDGVSVMECASRSEKKEENGVAGLQDKILRESFLGTFDVHVNNLTAPHPSRATRMLHHDHVGSLTESFQDQDCGQLVILIGMLTSDQVQTDSLAEEDTATVEVLGGNHTRQALQSLFLKGLLTSHTVKVNLYKPLPLTAALAIGYQHNALLHERKRPLNFMDKVRLMRQCRPAVQMSKSQLNEWKDMLVTVFRAKVIFHSFFAMLYKFSIFFFKLI